MIAQFSSLHEKIPTYTYLEPYINYHTITINN